MSRRTNGTFGDHDVQFLTERNTLGSRGRRSSTSCTLDFEREEIEIVDDVFSDEVIDLTADDHDFSRHSLLSDGEISLGSYSLRGLSIVPGTFLEIRELVLGKHRISFLLVRVIVRLPGRGQIKLRGVPLARSRHLLGKLPRKANEVCMILHYGDRTADACSQGLIDVAPAQVIGKRTVNLTSAVWPQHHTDVSQSQHIRNHNERARVCEREGSLTCR